MKTFPQSPVSARATHLGQYWKVFAGTGVALVLVAAGLTAAINALKAEAAQDKYAAYLSALDNLLIVDDGPGPVLRPAPTRQLQGAARTLFLPPAAQSPATVPSTSAPRAVMAVAKKVPPAMEPEKDDTFGTKIHFQATPAAAFKKAQADDKLVFVLHVSGNFEDPQCT